MEKALRGGARVEEDLRDYRICYSIITGYWDEGVAPHGKFVLSGSRAVEGKLMKMPWGYRTKRKAIPANDFLGRGLEDTILLYG